MNSYFSLRQFGKAATEAHRNLSEKTSDFQVTIGRQTFHCHGYLLGCWSGYFRRLFGGEWREQTTGHVTLPEDEMVNRKSFGCLLKWMYEGTLELSSENVLDVMKSSNYFQIETAEKLCANFIEARLSNLDGDNMIKLLVLSVRYGLEELREVIVHGIAQDFANVSNKEDFMHKVAYGELKDIITHKCLFVENEVALFEAITAWLMCDITRLDHVTSLMECVRVGVIPVCDIRRIVTFEILTSNAKVFELLLHAMARPANEDSATFLERTWKKAREARDATFHEKYMTTCTH